MLQYYKKINYINELENIIQTMKNLQMSKEEIDRAEELKLQITNEPDVTLEDVMAQEIELTVEEDFETKIKEEIERLKSIVPIYIRDLEAENNTEKYKSILENNIDLLKYVSIETIKGNVDFYDEYFKELGIDINEFLKIDERVQQLNQDIKKSLRIDKVSIKREQHRKFLETASAKFEIFKLLPDKVKEEDLKWCKMCVIRDSDYFKYVPDRVKEEDFDWCKTIVGQNIIYFEYVPDKVKEENPDWCKDIVSQNIWAFQHVPDRVKEEDPEWCKGCVALYRKASQNFLMFQYVPDKVKEEDPKWCKGCVDLDRKASKVFLVLQYVPDRVKEEDPKWCKGCVDLYRRNFEYVPDKVKEENPDWCKDIVSQNIWAFQYVPDKVKEEDPQWCKDIVSQNIWAFQYVPDKVKEEDSQWCKDFVSQNIRYFQYVPNKAKEEDPDWCKDIVSQNIWAFQYVPDRVKEEDSEWCKGCVDLHRKNFEYVPDKVKEENPQWCKDIASQNIWAFQYVPDRVKEEDIGFCESVIMKTPDNFVYLPEKVKNIIIKNGNTEMLEKIIEIAPYRVITLNIEEADKYLKKIRDIKYVIEFEYVAESMSEYINDFYNGELNLERMKAIAPSNEKILQTEQNEIDIMKNIFEGISFLETDKDEYQERADELFNEYKKLRDKDKLSDNYYEELKLLMYKVGTLEMEIGAKNNSYSSRKEAEEVYSKRREELIEMISRIKTMNPELAERYEQELKSNNDSNIEHIIQNGTGNGSSEEIDLENKVQFYLNSNSTPPNNQLVIYNQKANGFISRIFGKLFKEKKDIQIKEEYDFSNTSLKELYEIQKKVNEEIRKKEEFKSRLQEGVGENNSAEGVEIQKNGVRIEDSRKKSQDIIPFDDEE